MSDHIDGVGYIIGDHCYQSINDPWGAARDLAARGMLVTPEMREALDEITAAWLRDDWDVHMRTAFPAFNEYLASIGYDLT